MLLECDKGEPKTLIDEDQRNGYVIDIVDQDSWLEKIGELMEDKTLRDELGKNGHQLIAKMGISNSFEAFWNEYLKYTSTYEHHKRTIK